MPWSFVGWKGRHIGMRYNFDYKPLDDLIVSKVESGMRRYRDLFDDDELFSMLEKYRGGEDLPERNRRPAGRVLDARLQAVKRQGRLFHDADDGWCHIWWGHKNVPGV